MKFEPYIAGDSPPAVLKAVKKNRIRDGMTLGQIVKVLGPGWISPLESAGVITWVFDDGSELRAWPEEYDKGSVLTFKVTMERSGMWFQRRRFWGS
jgi:hypothetical protein